MSLELTNIQKKFGNIEVLSDVNITIEDGDFLVLLGASGCGKSTLLNCIAGLEETTAGTVKIKGEDVTGTDASQRNVAMVFQSYALYPTMTVARNISFCLECQGVKKADRKAAVDKVAKLLHITELLDRRPSQLSGGQRQRVAIGRALVRDPDIFLLDEPMSNLDTKLRNQMRVELRDLHKQLGATFVLVTHDQIEAMSMATKVAVLDKGRVQQFGTPYELFHKPENMFVATFIGLTKMNFLAGTFELVNDVPHVRIGGKDYAVDHYLFAGEMPPAGHEIVLGVRPENVYRQRERLEGEQYIEVEIPVVSTELTGGDVNVEFSINGQPLLSRFRSTRTPEPGSLQRLFLDVAHCSMFDKQTQKRV
ncbi:MAG: ABC transporter ATP-binding protein [Paracoccaceae bacterium]